MSLLVSRQRFFFIFTYGHIVIWWNCICIPLKKNPHSALRKCRVLGKQNVSQQSKIFWSVQTNTYCICVHNMSLLTTSMILCNLVIEPLVQIFGGFFISVIVFEIRYPTMIFTARVLCEVLHQKTHTLYTVSILDTAFLTLVNSVGQLFQVRRT